MSINQKTPAKQAAAAPMSVFERYLTVWVFLCIVAGIALGQLLPYVFQDIGRMEIAKVNLPVGLLIWVMIIPMLVKVDFGALGEVRIKAVHRGERSLEPKADLRLVAGDRLVLFGTAVAMEQAEQRLCALLAAVIA